MTITVIILASVAAALALTMLAQIICYEAGEVVRKVRNRE